MTILAIDPGDRESAYVLMNEYTPITFGKVENGELRQKMPYLLSQCNLVVIEMIASYGMAVSSTVFETCLWIGRFFEIGVSGGCCTKLMYRMEVKMNLCHVANAKDSNIRQALVDRFAKHSASGKGTKKKPDFFYGFAADVWAAYAVGVTYLDQWRAA